MKVIYHTYECDTEEKREALVEFLTSNKINQAGLIYSGGKVNIPDGLLTSYELDVIKTFLASN